MTENVNEVVQAAEEAPVLNQEEQKAVEDGWQPLEKWVAAGNDSSTHRSAREFNDRGELLRKISEQNRYIQKMNSSVETLRIHNQKVYENAYNKALSDLKAQHASAVENGEIQKADRLVDQIAETRAAQAANEASQRATQAQTVNPALDTWKERNPWYDEDEDMKTFADAIAAKFVAQKQGAVTQEEVLKHVDTKVKAKFEKPVTQKVAAPSPVAAGGRPTAAAAPKTGGLRKSDLSDDELKAMRNFVSAKLGDEASFLKQLAEIR